MVSKSKTNLLGLASDPRDRKVRERQPSGNEPSVEVPSVHPNVIGLPKCLRTCLWVNNREVLVARSQIELNWMLQDGYAPRRQDALYFSHCLNIRGDMLEDMADDYRIKHSIGLINISDIDGLHSQVAVEIAAYVVRSVDSLQKGRKESLGSKM